MSRLWLALGALYGLLAVALAAHAAHGLPPERSALGMTGASLGAWHALALLGVGLLAERRRGALVPAAGLLFALGALLFCGGVALRALTDLSLGLLTPLGGVLLLAGWGVLGVAALLAPAR